MVKPGILIISSDAQEYLPLLEGLGASMSAAASAGEARAAWSGQTVILGQPDLVAGVIGEMPGVRWVQSTWAGVTPLLAKGNQDYLLTGVKDTFGPQMAEYVFACLLSHEVRLFERLGCQANRSWWQGASGSLHGKTLGLMGTGSIGRHIAGVARPFGMRVIGFSRSGNLVEGFEKVYPESALRDFLAVPDYLVCVLPDTPDTESMLDARAFRHMRKDCYLVNVGRGGLIDEDALVEALTGGNLAGAALDVFRSEPLPQDSPLWHVPGLIVTGHVAAISWPQDIAAIFRENYRRYCSDESLKYVIDFKRGY